MMTITARHDIREPLQSFISIRTRIDTLMKRLKRAVPDAQYVRVYEAHKKGAFHAHFIVSDLPNRLYAYRVNGKLRWQMSLGEGEPIHNWAMRTWLKKTNQAIGLGYIADVRPLDDATNALRYVTKYLTKSAQDMPMAYVRRVQTTKLIGGLRSEGGDSLWQSAFRMPTSYLPAGWRLRDMDTSSWLDHDDLASMDGYPPD